ncbi:imm11 family protein [Pyxidicoccus sp. 3LG]
MERRFFSLDFEVDVPGRWYLAEPTSPAGQTVPDIWAFVDGRPVEAPGPLRVPFSRPGRPLDFDKTTVGGTPIVSARVASVFREMAPGDVQLFPVEVESQTEPYSLLNVARTVRCIDDAACEEVQLYTEEDEEPERHGEYRSVSGLRIDKAKVGDARVFRLWGYHIPIIVDGELKEALERAGITGGRFDEV